MRVLVLSLVTNKVVATPYRNVKAEVAAEFDAARSNEKARESAEEKEEAVNHEEVLEMGRIASRDMSSLVEKIVELAGPTL